ncbi:hypothetical protein [Microbacterium maritypicum]|uniref:Uncharacterized protein n=1 Tax=Microbacterium maritypicum MF109 TaxID=1333857 RepID=T5KNQ4_MICMQ|nr:hypothetical protein [Microbacterium liquefaciens]EQM78203.1 hypothetical protein L687_16890 [Microbacterium maritypicum MF109]
MKTFTEAVETFLTDAADWLADEDSPAVVFLEQTAAQLDTKMTPALLSQFGLTYRSLLKKKPVKVEQEDELAKALAEAEQDQ